MRVELSLLPHQKRLVYSTAKKSLLLCGRGAGKSYVCAAMTLLHLLKGKTVLLGGQRFDTLHDTLYAEIKKMAMDWGIYDRIEWKEAPMMMTLGDAHVFFGTYCSVDACRGYSRVSLIILDEMFLAPFDIMSIWGPCCRGTEDGEIRWVGATTPRSGSLWNVKFADPDCDWEIIRASTMDNTEIKQAELDIILSEIHDQNMYEQEIEGKLVTDLGANALIHLKEFPTYAAQTTDTRVLAGLDCGEGVERDCTAFFARRGNTILDAWELAGINHEETVRRILEFNKACQINCLRMDAAFSDYEFTTLKYYMPCEQIHFAGSASEANKRKYANIRAEMFFNFAKTIKSGLFIDIPKDRSLEAKLKRQMCAIGWHKDSTERLLITKKEDLRAVLKCSPDIADAGALTCTELWTGDDPVMNTTKGITGMSVDEEEEIMSEY